VNDNDRKEFGKDIVELLASLQTSAAFAGGAPEAFSPEQLERMTAWELLCTLAPNGIRFVCVRAP
jgi:hypothetical protein